MRVHLDFTSAIGDGTGVGTYTRELASAMLANPGDDRMVLTVHAFRQAGWHRRLRRLLGDLHRPPRVRASRIWPHGVLLEAWRLLPRPTGESLFGACDVFHGTNFLAPPHRRARVVVTVHDLAFLRLPEEVPVAHRYHRYLADALRRADRVLVPSAAARDDAVEFGGVPDERVTVVPHGGPIPGPRLGESEFAAARRRLGIPRTYVLFVGTLEPRKNLARLLRAFRQVHARLPDRPALVLAGRKGWHDAEIRAEIEKTRHRAPVICCGYVPAPLLGSLYADARAFVFPSLWEGFGLPVLEAFAAGAPVLAANAGALPEVAGDAALLVDPRSEDELAAGLCRLLEDPDLREELAARGRRRVLEYSWSRCARETREVYRHA